MFVEIQPGHFLNFGSCLVVQASMGYIGGSLGIGNASGDNVKIGSQMAAIGVLRELMNRVNEGRKVVFVGEFSKLCSEINGIFPDVDKDME
jgi:hypothetical protein